MKWVKTCKVSVPALFSYTLISPFDCRGGGLVADIYETTPVMSTYILAFVVGDFGHKELQARPGLTVRIFSVMLSVFQ